MRVDIDDLKSDSLSADVCVIGAGPAGLTVAAELADAGADVLVLEAGGSSYDRHDKKNRRKILADHLRGAQSLTRGRASGEPYYPLRMSRARGLAGSTNALLPHGLRARPLDPLDFGPRFGSRWPISYEEFSRFVPTAEVYAGIREPAGAPIDWAAQPLTVAGVASQQVAAAPFRHGRRDQFPQLATRLAESGRPRLVTSAVVTGIEVSTSSAVQAVNAVSLAGASVKVNADIFVLAAGGIDNARLMLASDALLALIDGSADLVGRNFMEHLHYVSGYLIPSSPDAKREIEHLFGDPHQPEHWLTPAADHVLGQDLLRVGFAAIPVHASSLDPAVPAAGELLRAAPYGPFGGRARLGQFAAAVRGGHRVIQATVARARGEEQSVFALATMSEQNPDQESRVTLASRRDQTGVPLPALHWKVGEQDFTDARRSLELVAAELERLGLGTVVSLWDQGASRPRVVTGGWHHMGTTIMDGDPSRGVVDENCRVHGVANLFVAGSSVFPTSGYANPTLTLVALAVRLGRHLAEATQR